MWILLVTTLLAIFLHIILRLKYSFWSKKGVAQVQPWSFFGNIGAAVINKRSFTEILQDLYNAFPDKSYCGLYIFLKPTLLLRSPSLIRLITVKEFDTFPEHLMLQSPEEDPLFSNNLLTMRGGLKWQDYRCILAPCFTRSKLKLRFMSMHQCAVQCITHICNQEGRIVVDLADVFGKYANDTIFTSVFGTTSNSFKNPENKFYLMGKAATKVVPWRSLKPFLNSINPLLVEISKPRAMLAQVSDFFRIQVIKGLQRQQIYNNNNFTILNLLTKPIKSNIKFELTDEDIVNQVFVMYLGGLNTSTSSMCFTIYELALNPAVQKKLQNEVDNTTSLTYDSLLEMKYLNMVISESLRKWPPITFSDRRSVKPITLESDNPGEKSIHLEAGTDIYIPIYSLHHDPEYYPDPEKFDPERFSDNLRGTINPLAYMPFGSGPRTCIGSRLALLEVKLIIYYLLRNFDIIPTEKTPMTVKFDPGQYFGVPKTKFWIELKPKTHTSST